MLVFDMAAGFPDDDMAPVVDQRLGRGSWHISPAARTNPVANSLLHVSSSPGVSLAIRRALDAERTVDGWVFLPPCGHDSGLDRNYCLNRPCLPSGGVTLARPDAID